MEIDHCKDWPYCNSSQQLRSVVLSADTKWDQLEWRRRLETFGKDDLPVIVTGSGNAYDGVWYDHLY
jgi:acid phosphatase